MSIEEAHQRGKTGYDAAPPSHYNSAEQDAWRRGKDSQATGPSPLYTGIETVSGAVVGAGSKLLMRIPSAYSIIPLTYLFIYATATGLPMGFERYLPKFIAVAVVVVTIKFAHKWFLQATSKIEEKGAFLKIVLFFLLMPGLKRLRIGLACLVLWYFFRF